MERLAEPQAPSRVTGVRTRSGEEESGAGGGAGALSAPARALLRFSTPRDPAALAAFVELRVLHPERAHWRRGVEAATVYRRLHGDLRVPFTYRVPGRGPSRRPPGGLGPWPVSRWGSGSPTPAGPAPAGT